MCFDELLTFTRLRSLSLLVYVYKPAVAPSLCFNIQIKMSSSAEVAARTPERLHNATATPMKMD